MTRFWLVCLAIAVLVIIPFVLWDDRLEALFSGGGAVGELEKYGAWAWAAGIVLLILDLFLPVPGSAVMGGLGILYGPVLGAFLSFVGTTLAGMLGYGIGRWLGRPAVHRLMGPQATEQGETLFTRAGGWIVALSRWLPVLPEVIACIAGVSRMRPAVFLAALVCGTLPLSIAFATIGHLGADRPILTLLICMVIPVILWPVADRLVLRRYRT